MKIYLAFVTFTDRCFDGFFDWIKERCERMDPFR